MRADVIIVGAGTFGLSCAYSFAKRGQNVRVYDADQIGRGASNGIVGAMSPHTPDQWNPKKQFQFEALRDAQEHWAQVDARSGQTSGYGRIGRWIPITSARELELAHARVDGAKENWGSAFSYQVIDTPARLQGAEFGVVYERLSARIFPAKATQSLAAACRDLGVEFITGQRVTGLDDHQVNGVWGSDSADAVILAAGVEGFALMDYLYGVKTGQGVKGQAALLAADLPAGQPQIFADGLYIIPHADGTVAIGSTSENKWGQPYEIDHQLDDLVQRASAVLPSLAGSDVIQRWAGLRPKARRRDPMLGALPDLSGVYAAMGAFKIGFGIAHKVGAEMADLILDGKDNLPPSFSVQHHLS